MNNLKIIHFNIRSLRSGKDLIEHYLNKEQVDIAMIQEHWLKPKEIIKIKNFNVSLFCRVNGYGGVAFLVRDNIKYKVNKMKNYLPIESLAIETTNLSKNIILISIYIPPSNIRINVIKKQFKHLVMDYNCIKNVLIAGDINAHNPLWEHDSKMDNRGIAIADILNISNFITLNNGDHTYIKENGTSAVDIALAHIDIASDCEWQKNFENLNSDHFITQTLFNSKPINYFIPKQSAKINYKKLELDLETLNISGVDTIEEFQSLLEETLNHNTTEIRQDSKYIPKYWWTDKIRNLWEIKRQKLKLYNKYKTLYTKIELKKSMTKLKVEIKKSKRCKFQDFIEEINPNTDIKTIYKKINLFNDKKRKNTSYNFSDTDLTDFVDYNYRNFNINYSPNFNYNKITEEQYSAFKKEEIENIIKKNKNTAPGSNKISNRILKLLNISLVEKITLLFNKIMINQKFPTVWSSIKVIPILKPNKDPNQISSYRPIALINTLTKIFNKLIKIRLDYHLDKFNLLPLLSFGFRKKKSTHECISYILHEVNENTARGFYTLVIVTDISKAFDHIILEKLISELNLINFNPAYTNMIHQFLYYKKYLLSNINETVFKSAYDGLPQGSTLSTTLFNIYTRKLHRLNTQKCQIIQFADDFTVLVKSDSISDLLNTATDFMNQFNSELSDLNLHLNIDKCSSIIFNHNKEMFNLLDIRLNNLIIRNVKHVKILGITLDKRLNFNLNVKNLKENCAKSINILKIFSKCKGGASPQTMLNIYNAIINSRIYYGTVLCELNKSNIQKIQTIQNQAIRICMGYIKSTPNSTILAESCQLPFLYQDEINTSRFITRQLYNKSHLFDRLSNSTSINKFQLINEKYNLISLTPEKSKHIPNKTNIQIIKNKYLNCTNSEKNNKIRQEMQKYFDEDYFVVFTDGSKSISTNGIGIYFKNNGEIFSYSLNHNVSIKCLEIIAILLAVKFSITLRNRKTIIFTDSLSSLLSIENCLNMVDTNKYFETKIINTLNNSNMYTILHWIPAHIGNLDHDIADKAAKDATYDISIDKLPVEEILNNIKAVKHSDWILTYNEVTLNKGLFYKNIINGIPRIKPWFKNLNFKSCIIKLINRLRSGHAFDKKTLFLMKIETTNLCDTCNLIEDAEHIITKCTKFNNVRK